MTYWHFSTSITTKAEQIDFSSLANTKLKSLSKLLVKSVYSIVCFFVFLWHKSNSELGCLMVEVSRSHRHTTVGRIPLDKGSARRRNLFSIVDYFKIIKRLFKLVIINKETSITWSHIDTEYFPRNNIALIYQ
jgi:hypothetical protein